MKCQHVPPDLDSSDCPTPASKRDGRRLYCDVHAPAGSVDLDKYALHSEMSDKDKADEYDKMAEYLREQGWEVSREVKLPIDAMQPALGMNVLQIWTHPEHANLGTHTLFSALKIEHFKDAPAQGARTKEMLASLGKVRKSLPPDLEKKIGKWLHKTILAPIVWLPIDKTQHQHAAGCLDCGAYSEDTRTTPLGHKEGCPSGTTVH